MLFVEALRPGYSACGAAGAGLHCGENWEERQQIVAGVALLYVLLLTAVANIESARNGKTRLLRALAIPLPVALLIYTLSAPSGGDPLRAALVITGIASMLLMLALIGAERPWLWVARIIKSAGRYERIAFDAQSRVHRLAALLLIFALVALSRQALRAEPQAFTDAAGAAPQLLVGALLYLALAILGVGWLTRRDWTAVLRRLGLRWPRPADWMAGVSAGIALYLLVALALALWQAVAEPSVFEAQASGARAIFEALSSSLLAGGLLAMSVAVGEEVLFRGALQPIFGLAISSLLFVALHTQYAFTPAAAMLFVVSLGFGLLRARASTTAAIIAHAAYNAIPFALAALQ